jgi:hypothetical protein
MRSFASLRMTSLLHVFAPSRESFFGLLRLMPRNDEKGLTRSFEGAKVLFLFVPWCLAVKAFDTGFRRNDGK